MRNLSGFESGKWLPIYLKLEEARFFFDNLRSHKRFPKLVLFYLSSFLSAARSITFHVQKQIIPNIANGKQLYEDSVQKYLSGEVAKFFINMRNISEKEMYLPLKFKLIEKHPSEKPGQYIFVERASSVMSAPSRHSFGWLEDAINTEFTSYTQPRWMIMDYPGGDKDLFEACEEYLNVIQNFVEEFRRSVDDVKEFS